MPGKAHRGRRIVGAWSKAKRRYEQLRQRLKNAEQYKWDAKRGWVERSEYTKLAKQVEAAQNRYYALVSQVHDLPNPSGRKVKMTKTQRRAKAKRAGSKRRKANAVKAFLKKMNPASKVPAAVKVTKLKGGGFTVKPIKKNFGRLRRIVRRVTRRRARR